MNKKALALTILVMALIRLGIYILIEYTNLFIIIGLVILALSTGYKIYTYFDEELEWREIMKSMEKDKKSDEAPNEKDKKEIPIQGTRAKDRERHYMCLELHNTRQNDCRGSERIVYAIKNTRTGKWMYGTDFRRNPRTQRTSSEKAMLFDEEMDAVEQFRYRQCGKDYKVVEVELVEV